MSRVGAAIQQDALSGDVACVYAAQESAQVGQISSRRCRSSGRDASQRTLLTMTPLCGPAPLRGTRGESAAQAGGIKTAGQQIVDRNISLATLRAMPATKAVRPARAPLDRSSPARGILTLIEVILTIRPNRRCLHGSMTFLYQFDRRHHVHRRPPSASPPVELSENRDMVGRHCC